MIKLLGGLRVDLKVHFLKTFENAFKQNLIDLCPVTGQITHALRQMSVPRKGISNDIPYTDLKF